MPPDLFAFADAWHPREFTQIVGVATIVEGAVAALAAACCVGRAITPLTHAPTQHGRAEPGVVTAAGGGPVLPICGILFLVASIGPVGQARHDSEALEVMESMPGQWGPDLVADFRRHERTEWTFAVLWLVVGGALMATPLFLSPRGWRLGWRMNGVGWGIVVVGLISSAMGAFVCFVNGLLMEAANGDFAFAGYLAVLAGAVGAVAGSIIAVIGRGGPLESIRR